MEEGYGSSTVNPEERSDSSSGSSSGDSGCIALLLVLALIFGCCPISTVTELEQKVTSLEGRIEQLETKQVGGNPDY